MEGCGMKNSKLFLCGILLAFVTGCGSSPGSHFSEGYKIPGTNDEGKKCEADVSANGDSPEDAKKRLCLLAGDDEANHHCAAAGRYQWMLDHGCITGNPNPVTVTQGYYLEAKDNNGKSCVATQYFTAGTHAEADRLACEAASDDKLNGYCGYYERYLWQIQHDCLNRHPRPQPGPAPVPKPVPTPEPNPEKTPLTPEEISQFNRRMAFADFLLSWSSSSKEVRFLVERISTCGLTDKGPDCLDAAKYFENALMYKTANGVAMELTHIPSHARFRLDMEGRGSNGEIAIHNRDLDSHAAGIRFVTNGNLTLPLDLPPPPTEYSWFFHRSRRALKQAQERANQEARSGRISCEACAKLDDMRKQFKDVLNRSAGQLVLETDAEFEEATLDLALDYEIKTEHLGALVAQFGLDGAKSGLGKAMVLDMFPTRSGLKAEVIDWMKNANLGYQIVGLRALGKTALNTEEQRFVFNFLFGPQDLRTLGREIVRKMKLADDDIDYLQPLAPRAFTAEMMAGIGTEKAVAQLLTYFNPPDNDLSTRVAAAKSLHDIAFYPDKPGWRRAMRSLDSIEKTEKDACVLSMLKRGICLP
jgi:hypothetical protein